jgi:hypothetical protein
MKKLVLLLLLITAFAKAQVPVMNAINGATAVCSIPSTPTSFSTSASNSPTSYSWSVVPSTSVIIPNPTNSITSISFPYSLTNYTVYCSASNGFGTSVSSVSFEISTIISPTITFSPPSPYVCIGSSTTVIASGANTYTWSNATTGNSITVSPTIATTYSVIGTNSITGCSTNSLVTINIQSLCPVGASSPNNTICIGQSTPAQAGIADSFSWYSIPSSIITATTINHSSYTILSPIITTTYYVTASYWLTPCPGTASFVINVISCLGVDELKNKAEDLKIYPNPTNGILNLEVENGSRIKVINVLGELVKEEELKSIKQDIDISNLKNGIYFLQVFDKESLIGITKIVKE